ncbi:NAD(P)/FAD-dependent oxidoreductase [Halorubrum halophilum]|uniref:phytoene desaturase family protein n=1 Tax=Halorubrum halophilum TaxID=413816 RepID=UPI00186B2671|nr:NAD(P)/FAD-dependent oxidoreductase [Halorubrum halophilum]
MIEDEHETVVVGAGLGGLVAGAKLAREGQSVLVLEQHSVPGGCATIFQRPGFTFEVSLHEIEGLDKHDVKRPILEELGVLDELSFEPIPEFYNYRRGDDELLVPHGQDDVLEHLQSAFPEEATALEQFFSVLWEIRESLGSVSMSRDISLSTLLLFPIRHRTFFRYRNTSLGAFLDDLFDDEELKLALTANLGYYHDDPYSMSLPYFAVAQGGYLTGGGYYIHGGSQALSDHLADIVTANGGTIQTERRVTDILVDGDDVTGVRHERSRPGTVDETGLDAVQISTDNVVANAALPLVAKDLLPAPHGDRLSQEFEEWSVAPSLTTLHLGFETPPSELGCDHYSTVIAPADATSLADSVQSLHGSYGGRTLSFVDYSQIDAGLVNGERAVGSITTIDYLEEWEGLTDAEYREKKQRVKEVLLRRLGEQFPELPPAVSHAELATPKTIRRYTLNPAGTAYGFAQTPAQSLLHRRFDSPVSNLAFASAWSFPGGGFTGAIAAGYRAATTLLEDR